MSRAVDSRLPSIPSYFKTYVDPHIDLETTTSIPCPFHNEVQGKSFSYSKQLGVWRCFGACHAGGDVIALHQLHYKIRTRKDAEKSLYSILGISPLDVLSFEKEEVEVNQEDVYRRRVYNRACQLAKTPDDYDELDYIVSKYPYDIKELELYCNSRGILLSRNNNEITDGGTFSYE